MRDYKLYLADIKKSAEKIQRYVSGTNFDDFLANEMKVDAVARNLEIIGEAVLNIPTEIRERYPEIEWSKIGGLRNLLAHGYFKVSEPVVWNIVQNKVPQLQEQIERILELEGLPEPVAITDTTQPSTKPQQSVERSESSNSTIRTIYPAQRERAAAIIPIALKLLEAGRNPNANLPTRKISPDLEELETKDYKLTLDEQTKTLTIAATDARQVLIKARLQEQTESLEFAGKLIPKDINKWQRIEQDLDKELNKQQKQQKPGFTNSPTSFLTDRPPFPTAPKQEEPASLDIPTSTISESTKPSSPNPKDKTKESATAEKPEGQDYIIAEALLNFARATDIRKGEGLSVRCGTLYVAQEGDRTNISVVSEENEEIFKGALSNGNWTIPEGANRLGNEQKTAILNLPQSEAEYDELAAAQALIEVFQNWLPDQFASQESTSFNWSEQDETGNEVVLYEFELVRIPDGSKQLLGSEPNAKTKVFEATLKEGKAPEINQCYIPTEQIEEIINESQLPPNTINNTSPNLPSKQERSEKDQL